MPQAAETCLNAADEDGRMPVALADEVAVDDRRVIRALPADTAGGKGVGLPMVMGNSIVIDHGVHIAAGNEKAKPRLPPRVVMESGSRQSGWERMPTL